VDRISSVSFDAFSRRLPSRAPGFCPPPPAGASAIGIERGQQLDVTDNQALRPWLECSCYSSQMNYRRDAANRGNSLRSTGPRSQEGKARSSQNSLRYAFLSRELLLPGEDSKQLSKLRERLRDQFKPRGPTEEILVQIMVSDLWRLGRLYRVESAILSGETMVRADIPTVITESAPQRIFEEPDSDVPF